MNETIISKIIKIAITERMIIRICVVAFGLALAGMLIAAWQCGLDLSSMFVGTPWNSPHEYTKGIIALEGGIVALTLLFGGLFIAGVMALIVRR